MSRAALGKAITDRLRELAGAVEETSPTAWRFHVGNGRHLRAEARLGAGWLSLVVAQPGLESVSEWDMAAATAGLPGLAKCALDAAGGQPQLRAEVPADADAAGECVEQLAAACAGFDHAARLVSKASPHPQPTGRAPAALKTDVAELCSEAGWPSLRHDADASTVSLDSGREPLTARVGMSPGGLYVRTELVALEPLGADSRAALARLLLAGNGVVRMARASIHANGNGLSAGLEVMCGTRPSAPLVGHALASLSIAARMLAPEAKALADETLAGRYLQMRGGHSPSNRDAVRRPRKRGDSVARTNEGERSHV